MMVEASEDLYAVLQASPTVYSPERLRNGPPEFQQLAAERRMDIEQAYAVLGDAERRSAYDRSRMRPAEVATLDFRPLPPAQGRERPSPSIPLPPKASTVLSRAQRGRRSLVAPLITAAVTLAVLLVIVLSGVRIQSGAQALATPVIPNLVLPYTPEQVAEARSRAETSNDPEAWVAFGNVLFDNIQIMRERAPLSPQYRNALPQWLEVSETYSRAIELGAGPVARVDLALAQFYYGIGANDPASIDRAAAEAERALADGPDEPRVLLNYGLIMVGVNPPREAEALAAWRHLVELAPDSFEAQQASALIGAYEQ